MTPTTWDGLLKTGTGPVQERFLDLVGSSREYIGYHPDVIWGNIQTPEYAAAMLRLVVDFHGIPDDIADGVTARTARAQYLGQPGRSYHVLLGEQALMTNIGGTTVMRAQLRWLLDATAVSGLTLGIIPAWARLKVYPGDGFGIFDSHRVEVEGFRGAETITDPDRVEIFHRAFELLCESAVYGAEAEEIVIAALAATIGS